MLALTLSLGFWQIERLAWKRGLLSEIERGEAMAPVSLGDDPPAFQRVTVAGRFRPGVVRYGAEVRSAGGPAVMGAHLVSALERPGADPVIVDRGWAPLDAPAEPTPAAVEVVGYVRPPEHTPLFGPKDDPVGRRFFALDPAAIGASLGLVRVAPYTIVAMGPPGSMPEPATALPRPPNDHLSYAITWFALSAALVGVLAVYTRQTLRQERP